MEEKVKRSSLYYLLVLILSITVNNFKTVNAQSPVVHAVLFYSPSCQACEQVKTGVFPILLSKYGDQFQLLQIDTTFDEGSNVYESAVQTFQIPDDRIGVPTLIIGETVLVGAIEIPQQLPLLIENGLRSGGIDWPEIPGLKEVLILQGLINQENISSSQISQQAELTPLPTSAKLLDNPSVETQLTEATSPTIKSEEVNSGQVIFSTESPSSTPNTVNIPISTFSANTVEPDGIFEIFLFRFNQDRYGNSLAVIVLLLMLVCVFYIGFEFIQGKPGIAEKWPVYILPILCIVGLFAAAYLTFVEFTHSSAICGPIGDCNTVQESPYAYLFGFIPVGLFGIFGYLVILLIWIIGRLGNEIVKKYAAMAIWIMAWFGVLFSIYLTFLEPFVIGATCAWCITSAIVISIILLASTPPVIEFWFVSKPEFEPDIELDSV